MDRAKAKSMTRTVQIFAVALVAAAGLAAVVPLTVKAEPVVASASPPPPKPSPVQASKVEIETTTAVLLNTVSGPVKNQRVEVPTPDPEPAAAPTEGPDSWRYLGGIISSNYKRAIVVVGGEQRLLAENQTLNDTTVVEIDKSFLKVKKGETESTIELAPRQKPVLTVIEPGAGGRGGNNPGMVQPVANPAARAAMSGTALSGSAASDAKNRQRDLQRRKDDAKARGDEKAAEMIDAEMSGLGKDGKGGGEKGQK